MPSSASFKKHVVVLAEEVEFFLFACIGNGRVGRGLAILRVEVQNLFRQRRHDLVINVGIKIADRILAFVGNGDPRGFAKGHAEVAVERPDRRAIQKCRLIRVVLPQIEAKEISYRNFHAGLFLTVPIHTQHDLLQMMLAGASHGEPDVSDDARPRSPKDFLRTARRDNPAIVVAAAAVITGLLERRIILLKKVARQMILASFVSHSSAPWFEVWESLLHATCTQRAPGGAQRREPNNRASFTACVRGSHSCAKTARKNGAPPVVAPRAKPAETGPPPSNVYTIVHT